MARFSVYLNPDNPGYLLDVQADIHGHFNTRVVVPLMPLDVAPKPAAILNPLFDIDGVRHSMVTQYMAAMPAKTLKNIAFNANDRHYDVVAALDMLLQGF